MTEPKKENRGGKRQNAGAKKLHYETTYLQVSVPKTLEEALKAVIRKRVETFKRKHAKHSNSTPRVSAPRQKTKQPVLG